MPLKSQKSMEKIKKDLLYQKISKIVIFFLVFLIPLFFGLGKVNILDFTKQAVLIFLSFFALIFWFFGEILRGKFSLRFSILHLISLGFLIIFAVSTIFSYWRWGSFWGWPLDSGFSFLTFLCFFILFLLLSNLFERRDLLFLQFFLILSGFFVALFGILQIFGKFLLPFDFTKVSSFNTIGTVNSWGVFLGALIPLILAFIFITKTWKKGILSILGIICFSGLIFSNYWVAWIGILGAMALFLVFGLWHFGRIDPKLLLLPMIIFSLALIFGIAKISIPGLPPTPLEVSPSLGATFDVSKEMLKSSLRNMILGFGPGTFKYGWSKFRSPALNQTIFWNIRFTKGGAEILEVLGTMGTLGTIFYLALIFFALFFGLKTIFQGAKKDQFSEWILALGIFCSLLYLSIIKFLYPSNLSLEFLWWVFFGSLVVFLPQKVKIFDLKAEPKVSFLFSFLAILILVGTIFLFWLEGTRYFAEVKYAEALRFAGDFEKVEPLLLEAIRWNPQQEIFWQDLAQVYLAKANQEILRIDIPEQERARRVSNFVANSVAASKRATEIAPENVLNWQIRGEVYRNIIGWSEGAFDWAVNCYERAQALEPTNPFILVQLGGVYLTQANLLLGTPEATSNLQKAEDYIKKALELKPDYAQAHFQMALVYETQGKREEAISTLEGLKRAAPFWWIAYDPMQDVGLAFQLGVLYYRDEKYDEAQEEFERAVALSPNYSNARYFLGLIYDRKGQKGKAIEQFVEIEKFNPENEEVKRILANLRMGKPALEGIGEALPIEEKPEER